MNDYDALRDYLMRHKQTEFVLSFDEIEDIIGAALRTVRGIDVSAAGFTATRMPDGKSVRFRKRPPERRR